MAVGQHKLFWLLLWKNWVLQKRKICVSIFEIIVPLFFAVILVVIRSLVKVELKPYKEYSTNSLTGYPNLPYIEGSGKLIFGYSPGGSTPDKLMNRTKELLQNRVETRPFASEADLLYFMANDKLANRSFGGVIFNNLDSDGNLPKQVSYTLRLNASTRFTGTWQTGSVFPLQNFGSYPPYSNKGPDPPGYINRGFISVQHNLDKAIIEAFLKKKLTISTEVNQFPFPPSVNDLFIILVLQGMLPFMMVMSFFVNVLQITRCIVEEKEKKLKESMKMMGLPNWLHWSAWFTKNFIYFVITISVITIFLCVNMTGRKIIVYSDASLIFLFLLLFSITTISYGFAVSVFFKTANGGAVASGVIYFLTYSPWFGLPVVYLKLPVAAKWALCLLPNLSLAMGCHIISLAEGTGSGVKWSTLFEPVRLDDNMSFGNTMMMFVVDTAILLFITWYVEAVFPGEYGVPRPFYFPFLKSYWCGETSLVSQSIEMRTHSYASTDSDSFEDEPVGLNPGIIVTDLRKVFAKGKVAVNDMNLKMYEGQVFALLGHNGAGKTTTINMLTGFIPSTSGAAIVNGFDIRENIDGVRSNLGLCPQHDILFDLLTVEEHLEFFCRLKGVPDIDLKKEMDYTAQVVGLADKKDTFARNLSGGQRRKLSVGIAFIGGSKVIILDEPTSGMDPSARRHTWDIINSHRQGRTIILTTHYMDEADILGDRIAIMADGVVKCCGSSLFLKKRYGAGYRLVLVRQPNCNVDFLTSRIKTLVPASELESAVGSELSYMLPHDRSTHFEQLFTELEQNREKLGLSSFGVSVTTMEEVFLKVGDGYEPNKKAIADNDTTIVRENSVIVPSEVLSDDMVHINESQDNLDVEDGAIDFNKDIMKYTGVLLFLQQFRAMLTKKAIHTWRNRTITIAQIIVPVLFTVLSLLFEKIKDTPSDDPALTFGLQRFRETITPIGSNVPFLDKHYRQLPAFNGEPDLRMLNPGVLMNNYSLALERKIGFSDYNQRVAVGATFYNNTNQELRATAWFNYMPLHAVPISINLMDNALLKAYVGADYSIEVTNHPLPLQIQQNVNRQTSTNFIVSILNVMVTLLGLSFLSASFTVFLVKEKAAKAKLLQFVSGVHTINFWGSNFVWDLANFLITILCLLIVFAAFQVEAYVSDGNLGVIFFLFLLFSWSVLPQMYLISMPFVTPAAAAVVLTILNIVFGVVTNIIVSILYLIPKESSAGAKPAGEVLDYIFSLIMPSFGLGQGIQNVYTNYNNKQVFLAQCNAFVMKSCSDPYTPWQMDNPCCINEPKRCGSSGCLVWSDNYFAWDRPGIGRYCLFMVIMGFLYMALVLVIEMRLCCSVIYKVQPPTSGTPGQAEWMDNDVVEENNRIDRIDPSFDQNGDELVIQNLTKHYGSLVAVNSLSVGIPRGELFGLLGVNGAGKTTTFRMLTGDETLTGGNAFIQGYDIRDHMIQVRQRIGYCPQFDAFIDQMTGRETLYMYARLRGVASASLDRIVNSLLGQLNLGEHADKEVGQYSGGNKRRLSTALALIGDSPIIFLDEPTTGVDPAARRKLWNTLKKVRESGRTLVLTSHSMEECEALCTRLGIMVNGQFMGIGSVQHLKNKYGQGFTVQAKVKSTVEGNLPDTNPLIGYINHYFPGAILKDAHQGFVHFHIPNPQFTWAYLFGTIERAIESCAIEEYTVGQTTLEEVFISFARAQRPPAEKAKGFFLTNVINRLCECC